MAAVRRSGCWALTASVVASLLVVGCGGATSATPPCSTSIPSAAPTTSAAFVTSTAVPEPAVLFPNQALLPVMVYVSGVVYDLAEAPARQIFDIGRSSLPYAGPPVVTEHGLLAATGEGYDSTLVLCPAGGGDPLVLARGVGSFALSEDGSRLAWAEPFQGPSGDAVETTRLVEAQFPSGLVIHTTTFLGFDLFDDPATWGFADVAAYVGDNVLLMTGDGAGATAAVWIPADGRVTMALGYDTLLTGNSRDSRVVVSPAGGTCGGIVSITAEGTVVPVGALGSDAGVGCWTSYPATFSPDGSAVAIVGSHGESGPPVLLLASSADGRTLAQLTILGTSGDYFEPYAIEWLNNDTLVLLAAEGSNASWSVQWGIFQCDTETLTCHLAQPIAFNPTGFHQVGLVANL